MTSIDAGTLRAGALDAFSANSAHVLAAGTVLDLNDISQTVGSLAGAGSVTLGAATLTAGGNNSSTTFSGALTGSGAFVKKRRRHLVLTGANNYTAGTTIDAGILLIGNGGRSGSISGDIVNFAALAINRSNIFTLSNAISGTGAFEQNGTGVTTLTGTNTYTGGTTINAGTLVVGVGGTGSIGSSHVTVGGAGLLKEPEPWAA